MTEERKEDLIQEWDNSNEMDNEEYRDWYEGLTGEEKALVDKWDRQYMRGTLKLCKDILQYEESAHE